MPVTIYDIAEKARVSHATVSRALNNHPYVNKRTKKNIERIAEKLGYRPSFVGKSLVTGKTHTLGLILPDLSNPFYIEFLRTIENGCSERGYRVITLEYALDAARERGCLEEMMKGRCDAVVAVIVRFDNVRDLIEQLWDRRFPCFIDGLPNQVEIGQTHVDGSYIDLTVGYKEAIEHLIGYGHKKIGFLQSIPPQAGDPGRKKALQQGFDKLGLTFESFVFSRFSGNHLLDGAQAMDDLIKQRPDITAVICSNDMVAFGAMKTMKRLGLRCPEDISVIGDNNTWLASEGYVGLTSIDQNTVNSAKSAVEIIFERLNNKDLGWLPPKRLYFGSSLVVRESTGPIRGSV